MNHQRKKLVVANWKLNGSLKKIDQYVKEFLNDLDIKNSNINPNSNSNFFEFTFCPPNVYLQYFIQQFKTASSVFSFGAQNMYFAKKGAYTGEISAAMLQDIGCKYVIMGHSERRQIFGESNELVARKVRAALEQNLIPILCVGETKEQRDSGKTQEVVTQQLAAVFTTTDVGLLSNLVVAYEPIWAIGTGDTASPEVAQKVHADIRAYIASIDKSISENICILYGGSIKGANATELFVMPDIDGGLVGGASLLPQEFSKICKSVILK